MKWFALAAFTLFLTWYASTMATLDAKAVSQSTEHHDHGMLLKFQVEDQVDPVKSEAAKGYAERQVSELEALVSRSTTREEQRAARRTMTAREASLATLDLFGGDK